MSAVFYLLLGWILTVASCVAMGTWVKRALQLEVEGWEDLCYRFLLGAAGLSLTMFTLASLGLIRKGVIYGVAVLACLSLYRHLPQLPKPLWHWSAIPFLAYVLFYLSHAMAPEISPDGMSYHLGLVARYYREHGFVWFATNMYAYLSQGLEMLFLFAYSIGRHSAAALVHFSFLLLLPLLLAAHAGLRGWLAGLVVFLMPVVGIDGISAYNDVALAVVVLGCALAMERWRQTNQLAWVSTAALLAGFAFSIKYTGVVALLFLLPSWRAWPRWLLASICALPWLVKNWLWSGNPLAPFFNAWFANPWFNVDFENDYRSYFRHYDLSGPLAWAKEVFLGGPQLSGTLGPVAILFVAALLGVRQAKVRRYLFAAACVLLLYPLNLGTRFLIPAMPLLALALYETFPRLAPVSVLAAAILAWPSVMSLFTSPYCWRLEKAPWRAALRIETEEGFLVRKSPGYVAARMIETFVPVGQSVYLHSPVSDSYCSRNLIVGYQSTIGLKMQHAMVAPSYEAYQPRFLYHCPTSKIEIAKDTTNTWSIIEIEPRPESAYCNRMPWDAGLLRDGNWLSRWRSWGPVKAADFCQLSGAGPYNVWGSGDQWEVELKGCTREMTPHAADFRAEARRYMQSQGIHYVAIDQRDFNAQDMIDNAALWQITLVAERGSVRLYRWNDSILPGR
ncbi:ArnT family glycosyltransferase [Bryobacter aggregatus]|uniref:ArnT family glycosyltransferase n=1 Tax=Bryobacter aggregatus TaxID=360054 RepID=UPI0004E11790|nr:hypothetical protein [Bryobacter aggregatus]